DRETDEVEGEHVEPDGARRRQVGEEPAAVMGLSRLRAEEVELVVGDTGDGELALDATLLVEQGSEADTPDRGQPVREERREACSRAIAVHVVLGEVGDLREADALPDGHALRGHLIPRVAAPEGDLFDRRLARLLEPEGMLQAVRGPPYGVGFGEAVVDGCR